MNSNARPYIEPGSAVVLTGRWFWCFPRERLVMSGDSFGCSSWQGGSRGAAGIQWVEAQDACQHPEVQCTAPTTKSHPQRAVVWRSPALVYGAQVWAQETGSPRGPWGTGHLVLLLDSPRPPTMLSVWCLFSFPVSLSCNSVRKESDLSILIFHFHYLFLVSSRRVW